ncbi:hypothetical protein HanRHA438_Chr13g0592831 [Helianthus annuus]|nr:hypothetical protein HanIR_Chr13g0633751 [Helianthus annuus]KAJ0497250.1 hypothetical protein HanHA89_Chr13g0509351 [Helianthus annuus]KAJ0663259.1 hypothetical protein HanLR1_Chr13g0479301 [Helianthus annuus]KAJ0670770.1 hypothetical protein HanOQP8_Chr13g0478321 [Helianthus annuus]KAJ0857672.1 hypothetical protein HanRHA438_Chr13g0592831 [Helianthus annuus]
MASSPSPSSLGDATSPPSSHAAAPPSLSVPSSPSEFSRLRRTKDVGLPLGDAVLPRRPVGLAPATCSSPAPYRVA